MRPRWRWTLVLALALVAVPAAAQDVILTPGLVNLEFRFANSNQQVINYLAANPVRSISWPVEELPVRMFRPGEGQPAARTDYNPGSSPPAASATAVARPDVAPTGSSFLVEVDDLALAGGAAYRFGTSNAIAPAARLCGPVFPQETHPAGTACNLSECAALLQVRISLKDDRPVPGGHADIDGLDGLVPIECGVRVDVEEAAYSGLFADQASSNATFDLATLRGGGGVLPVLVRGDGSRARVNVSCKARVKDDQNGFVLIPGTDRRTPLAPPPAFATPACDTALSLDLPIEVEREAGVLKGLFDVNGRTETLTQVWFWNRGTEFALQPPVVPAGSVPSPGAPWTFAGAPSTTPTTLLDVGARALVDGGRRYLELPHRRNLNDGVDVPRGGTRDLGSTFVTRPHSLPGRVILDDRGVGIGLDQVRTTGFSSLSDYYDWGDTSLVTAAGMLVPPGVGKSGDGGLSHSALAGTYDTNTGKARLDYELLLTGLSDAGDPPDGSRSAPTPWLVKDLTLAFGGNASEARQYVSATIGALLPRTTRPIPASGAPLPLEPLPELHMCLGKVTFTLKTDPAHAQLYGPGAWGYVPNGAPILTIPGDPFSVYWLRHAGAWGAPVSIQARTDSVDVSLLLPAGSQYWVNPSVFVSSPDGQESTYAWLSGRLFPAGGPLQCGQAESTCAEFAPDGTPSEFSLTVTPPVPACQQAGGVAFQVVFDNDRPVRWLKLQVDNQAEQELCRPCTQPDGSTPPVPVSLTVPADGQSHTVRVWAEDEIACPAEHVASVLVPAQPLTLVCAPDFTCTVPSSEIPLSSGHSCIRGGLTDPQVVGGCQYPTTITPDPENPSFFPLGATDVWFRAGEASCSTTVTVARRPDRQLAYAEGQQLKVRELGTGLYQMTQTTPAPIRWLEFDAEGGRLGAALKSALRAAIVYDVEAGSERYHMQTHPEGDNLQFNPVLPEQVALVTLSPSPPWRYWVELYRNEQRIGEFALPREDYSSHPEIAWSPDGRRLLALYTAPQLAGGVPTQGPFRVRIYDWDVAALGLANPTTWSMDRAATFEEPFEAIYYGLPGAAIFCSHRGVSKAGGSSVLLMSDVPNDHMDLTRDARLAAYVKLGAGEVTLGVLESPGSSPPVIHQGPRLPVRSPIKPYVAISDDGSRIAVSLADRIEVFAYPGFRLVESFAAQGVQHMRFRPLARGQNAGP
jgi:hypothetical protein